MLYARRGAGLKCKASMPQTKGKLVAAVTSDLLRQSLSLVSDFRPSTSDFV
jgi:arginyl-tRNA--protein-N-Asp/Glu arginylyltransferase